MLVPAGVSLYYADGAVASFLFSFMVLFTAGFALIPWLGLIHTLRATSTLNLVAGGAFLAFGLREAGGALPLQPNVVSFSGTGSAGFINGSATSARNYPNARSILNGT